MTDTYWTCIQCQTFNGWNIKGKRSCFLKAMGWQDDAAQKGTYCQSLTCEFSPHGGREDPIPTSCPLNSTHAHPHTYMHTQ